MLKISRIRYDKIYFSLNKKKIVTDFRHIFLFLYLSFPKSPYLKAKMFDHRKGRFGHIGPVLANLGVKYFGILRQKGNFAGDKDIWIWDF